MKTVYFFGNGASMPEGAPANSRLLQEALENGRHTRPINRLRRFLDSHFPSPPDEPSLRPTFEEVLTFVDLALRRQEALSELTDVETLQQIREDLVYALCRTLDETLKGRRDGSHSKFLRKLDASGVLTQGACSFLTTNYDILLDNALLPFGDVDIDYGISFRNEGDDWEPPRPKRGVHVLKLHGSLNWLLCTACNTIKVTPRAKGVMRVWTEFSACENDETVQRPLIVPPSHQKVMESPHLSKIWLEAEQDLRLADCVVFIGYSLSEADSHVRYLLKRGIHGGEDRRPRVVVVTEGGRNIGSDTESRYRRFFGAIDWRPIGFEAFVEGFEGDAVLPS